MSNSQLKPISFETTGMALEQPSSTGLRPIATGSVAQHSFPRPRSSLCMDNPRHELPMQLHEIVSEGQALLISWLRFSRAPLDERYHDRALVALDAMRQSIRPYVDPATPEQIIDMLTAVANVLAVELPEEQGLALFVGVLDGISAKLLTKAAHHVLRTHKYKSMPVPHDFLVPIQSDVGIYKWFDAKLAEWTDQIKFA